MSDHNFHYQWWCQNDDNPWVNDKSEIIVIGNKMTLIANEHYKKTYTLIGTPRWNAKRLEQMEDYAIGIDEPSMVEDAAWSFECKVPDSELYPESISSSNMVKCPVCNSSENEMCAPDCDIDEPRSS